LHGQFALADTEGKSGAAGNEAVSRISLALVRLEGEGCLQDCLARIGHGWRGGGGHGGQQGGR
jgi:hypothetical protein